MKKEFTAGWLLFAFLAVQPVKGAETEKKPADDPVIVAMAKRECTTLDDKVLDECVTEYIDAHDYPDEYMRGVAIRRALAHVREHNKVIDEARWEKSRQDRMKRCNARGFPFGEVRLGMTAHQVLECGWGGPESRRRTTDQSGIAENWFYEGVSRSLYFRNGRVVVIRD